MKHTLLIITIILLIFQSCVKSGGCDVDPPAAYIHYIDKFGNDLFKNGQNGYIKDSVAILNLNGNKIPNYVDFANWTPSTLLLSISTYTTVTNNYCTLIIHLKEGINDTLKMHLISNPCTQLDSIWYNGQIKKAGSQVIGEATNPDLYTTLFSIAH